MKCWKGKSRVSPNSARLSRSTGGRSGLVHISEVANTYVSDVNEYLKVGQTVKVKVIGISDEGRINLSIKRALEPQKPESAPRSRDAQPKREKPARTPVPPAASTSGNMDFEDRLKKFMQESDSRIADNRMYSRAPPAHPQEINMKK